MSASRRKDILRRLGSPRFRHQCRCGRIVDKLYSVWEAERIREDEALTSENMTRVCAVCSARVERRNEQVYEERARQKIGQIRTQSDMRYHASRSSNHNYLAACERMRREVPEASWGLPASRRR